MKVLFIFAASLAVLPHISAERILVLSPLGSKSHNNFLLGFAKPLAEKGHHVTFVSPYKTSVELETFREVVLPTPSATTLLSNVFTQSMASFIDSSFQKLPNLCLDSLASQEVQDLKKDKYDLIIMSLFFDFCFLTLVDHFKVPLIYASPAELFPPFTYISGSFEMPSLVTNPFINAKSFPFSFWERFRIISLNYIFTTIDVHLLTPKIERLCKERGLCAEDMPPFAEFSSNSSLTIVNSIKQFNWPPRPEMPHIIYAGGCHLQSSPKKMTQELENWVDASGEHGFIYFSLGSAVKPSDMPESYRRILVKVFASLDQQVLWKWDGEAMEDLSPNVKLGKWFPQQDILTHPKLRVFISHGGLLSTRESTYHGVPIIGMPLFADQIGNIAKAVSEGWALAMPWSQLEEDALRKLILRAISDDNLRKISQKRSKLMRDAPRHPADEAVFWIEYVLRHDGAEHLRSPLHRMPFYVLYNIDVYATMIGILLAFCLAVKCSVKCLVKRCFKKKKIPSRKEKSH